MSKTISHNFSETQDLNEAYCISEYMTDAERSIYLEDYNPDQQEFSFSRKQSKYLCRGGSKAGNTELRVAGSILHLINSMIGRVDKGGAKECRVSFTKADIARMVKSEAGEGISERTVQRYLGRVLDKLHQVYDICSEVKHGRDGCIYVWTAEFDAIEKGGQREFDPTLIPNISDPILRQKCEAITAQKRETKRSSLTISKAKGNLSKGVLIKLAFGLVRQKELPAFKNFEVSNWDVVNLLVERLGAGEWRSSAWHAVCDALVFTDRAMTEYTITNPVGYARHNLRSREVDVATPEELHQERIRHAREVASSLRNSLPEAERNEKFLLELTEKWRHAMTAPEYADQLQSASRDADELRRKLAYFEAKAAKLAA